MAIGLGGLNQTIEFSRGMSALGCGAEHPVLSTDDKGANGPLGGIVIDRQAALFQIADQVGLLMV